jgi:hypothetical protein
VAARIERNLAHQHGLSLIMRLGNLCGAAHAPEGNGAGTLVA